MKWMNTVSAWIVAINLTGILCGSSRAYAEDTLKQPPADTAQAEALIRIKAFYDKRWDGPNTSPKKRAFAHELMQRARTIDDSDERYVLLLTAHDLFIETGDCDGALSAISDIGKSYRVDVYKLRGAAITQCSKVATLTEQSASLAKAALELLEESVSRDDFRAAEHLSKLAIENARKSKNVALIKRAVARNKEIAELNEIFVGLKSSLEELERSPLDPDANLAIGKYCCFYKHDWLRGLPMLALGANPQLKHLAIKELAEPTGVSERLWLGDTWWDVARSEKRATLAVQRRAVYWYGRIVQNLHGIDRDRVSERISEVNGMGELTGPIELLDLVRKKSLAAGWSIRNNHLVSPRTVSQLLVPYVPPAEYHVRLVLERKAGVDLFSVVLPANKTAFQLVCDSCGGTVTGLQLIDGKKAEENPSRVTGKMLPAGRRHVLDCYVTKESVLATLNQREIANWRQFSSLSALPIFKDPGKAGITLFTYESEFEIHEFKIEPFHDRPVSLR
jgi:hypothetical protein